MAQPVQQALFDASREPTVTKETWTMEPPRASLGALSRDALVVYRVLQSIRPPGPVLRFVLDKALYRFANITASRIKDALDLLASSRFIRMSADGGVITDLKQEP